MAAVRTERGLTVAFDFANGHAFDPELSQVPT